MPTDLQEGKITVPVNADGTVSTPAAATTSNTNQPLANQANLNAVTQAAANGAAAGSSAIQVNNQPKPPSSVQIYGPGSTYPGSGANTTNIIYPNNAATNNSTGGIR